MSDVDRILDALGHRVRRGIIRELGRRGSASYTELMKAVGVEDSGTFAFHLRKLQDFVRKNERGEYELTELGRRAYTFLRLLEGEEKAVEEVSRAVEEKRPVVAIENRLEFVFTRSYAEELRRSGKKAAIRNVVRLMVEPMPPELFRSVIDSIERVVVVEAPRELHDAIHEVGRDVALVRERRREGAEFVKGLTSLARLGPSIASVVIDAVSKALPSALRAATVIGLGGSEHREVEIGIPQGFRRLVVVADSSTLRLRTGARPRARIRFREYGDYSIDVEDDALVVTLDGSQADITLPAARLEEAKISADSSTVELSGVEARAVKISLDSSIASIAVEGVEQLDMGVESSMVRGELVLADAPHASVALSLDASSANLWVRSPGDAKVRVRASEIDSSLVEASIDGRPVGLEYEEEGWSGAPKRVELRVSADSSVAKLSVEKAGNVRA